MTTIVRASVLAGLLAALTAAPTSANGGRGRTSYYYYPSYSSPVVVGGYYYQAVPVYPYSPGVVCGPYVPATGPASLPVKVTPYAQPKAAPPSDTMEPPTAKGEPPLAAPKVSESRAPGPVKQAEFKTEVPKVEIPRPSPGKE